MKALHITGVKNSMIQLVVSWATADLYLFAGRADGRSDERSDGKTDEMQMEGQKKQMYMSNL